MSYSDYLDGLRDGLYIGTKVGFKVGYEVGKISGFLDGYDEGYSDSMYNLPYKPIERLLETKTIFPIIEEPKFKYFKIPKIELPIIKEPEYLDVKLPKYHIPTINKPDPIFPVYKPPKPIELNDTFLKKSYKIKSYWDYVG